MDKSTTLSKRDRGIRTPSQRARLTEQRVTGKTNRAWHDQRVFEAEKRAEKKRRENAKKPPEGGVARARALFDRLLGGVVSAEAVQAVDRDQRGRKVPHANTEKDRSLPGKARIRARKAAQREARRG